MKSFDGEKYKVRMCVAPARERGLKFICARLMILCLRRSREGAWIEIVAKLCMQLSYVSRSREGAWIEILKMCNPPSPSEVAPARERGLKSVNGRLL